MAHPIKHAESSARKFGGKPEDYLAIHNWFDESKAFFSDFRHRGLRHHAEGIFLCERIFGMSLRNSDGREIPIRIIGEQHIKEIWGAYQLPRIGSRKSSRRNGCTGSDPEMRSRVALKPPLQKRLRNFRTKQSEARNQMKRGCFGGRQTSLDASKPNASKTAWGTNL